MTGNRGRLLDPRRTPVVVTDVAPNEGGFEVQIEAFEDQGARWELPLEEVGRFQFEHGASRAGAGALAELKAARERFDRELVIDAEESAKRRTLERIAVARRELRERLASAPRTLELDAMIATREGHPELFVLTEKLLAERGLQQPPGHSSRAPRSSRPRSLPRSPRSTSAEAPPLEPRSCGAAVSRPSGS